MSIFRDKQNEIEIKLYVYKASYTWSKLQSKKQKPLFYVKEHKDVPNVSILKYIVSFCNLHTILTHKIEKQTSESIARRKFLYNEIRH